MAEPVIVPVQLEVTDIDMSNFNPKDVQKAISTALSGVKKSIQDAFSGINASAINKPIESAMTSVKKSVQAAEDAQLRYSEALIKAGKSTEEYKSALKEANSAISNQQARINDLSQLGPAVAPHLAEAQKKLTELIDARTKIDPLNFVDKAAPIELEKVANAYKKMLTAQDAVTKQSDKFNQTVKDNRASDEYNELVKQAEVYRKKLKDLNEKSKEMQFKGATDTQWENLRKDVEWTSSKMDDVIKKMDKAVKSGKAFRFGDGPKGEFRNQINSFAMSARNNAGNASQRAKSNQSPYTTEYQTALNELDKLEKKMKAIRDKSAKMLELGASKQQFENLAYEAEKLDVEVDEVKNSLMAMVNEGKAFKFGTGDNGAEIQNIRDKSAGLQSALTGVATNAKKAQGGLTALGATHPKLAAILGTVSKIAAGFGKVIQVAGKVGKSIINGFKGVTRTFSKVTSYIGKMTSGFFGSKASSAHNAGIKKLTRNIMMFGLGFRTAYYLIKRLRNIFIEGFKTMGEQFNEVGEPMKEMMTSFERLKGSLATAFQPIVSVLMPILTRFMNYLSGMLETFGKFTATLTGQGHIYKAVAKDINSVSKAAKGANNELGSYDKLEVISDNNSGYEYEKQDISATEDAASNFAQMVKDAWAKADFTDVGKYVTEQLLGVLTNVETNIIPKVTDFVNRLLKSINTFLTGFDAVAIGDALGSIVNTLVSGLDFEQMGALFANLSNTVWGLFSGLVNKIDWTLLGQSLSTGFVSMAETLDFNKLSGMVTGLTMGIINVISLIEWDTILNTLLNGVMTLLQSLGDAMRNSDNPVVSAFGDVILTLKDAINLLKPAVDSIIKAVGPIVNAVLPIITQLLPPIAGIVTTIVTTLMPPLVRLIETVMSPLMKLVDWIMPLLEAAINTVSLSLGKAIDIISIVVGAIDLVISTVNVLSRVFRGEFSSIEDIFKELLKAWKTPINNILAAFEGLANGIISGVNTMIRAMNKLSFDIPDWVPVLGGKKFGFNFKEIQKVSIPRLAQGAVIPPNKEFLAMLGDQKSGTNIEAPLDTIKQAVAEVLAEMGGGSREPIVLQVDGRTMAKVVWNEAEKRYKQTGKYSMA